MTFFVSQTLNSLFIIAIVISTITIWLLTYKPAYKLQDRSFCLYLYVYYTRKLIIFTLSTESIVHAVSTWSIIIAIYNKYVLSFIRIWEFDLFYRDFNNISVILAVIVIG